MEINSPDSFVSAADIALATVETKRTSPHIDNDEMLAILECYDLGFSIVEIANTFGRSHSSVSRLVRKFHPTTVLAEKFVRASAMKLAQKVVKHATVAEAVDVLSRPNIGVLKPIDKGGSAPGIFVSVNQGDLGAVQITAGAQSPHTKETTDGVPSTEGQPRTLELPARAKRYTRPLTKFIDVGQSTERREAADAPDPVRHDRDQAPAGRDSSHPAAGSPSRRGRNKHVIPFDMPLVVSPPD